MSHEVTDELCFIFMISKECKVRMLQFTDPRPLQSLKVTI